LGGVVCVNPAVSTKHAAGVVINKCDGAGFSWLDLDEQTKKKQNDKNKSGRPFTALMASWYQRHVPLL